MEEEDQFGLREYCSAPRGELYNGWTVVISGVCIVLTGYPERVHQLADVLEHVMPGEIAWSEHATLHGQGGIILEGRGVSPELNADRILSAIDTRPTRDAVAAV